MEAAEVVDGYGRILAASERMLAAAERSQWDALVDLELARRELIATVTAEPGAHLSDMQRAKKREFITRTLEIDGRVRALTQSWMAELQVILTSVQAQRKLSRAYEAG